MKPAKRSIIQLVVIYVVVILVCLTLVEGIASLTVSTKQLVFDGNRSPATQFDEYLGWAGARSVRIPDMYGRGKHVYTNSSGFRNTDDTSITPPEGKLRILCSGDSFTYGQGVGNDDSWCQQLADQDDRLVTVNMAMPGYGIDQMYLRYLRDGHVLEHAVHIFAFVSGDLTRAAFDNFYRYGKPVLSVEQEKLSVVNTPVSRLTWTISRAVNRADFRSIYLGQRLLERALSGGNDSREISERVGPIALQVFEDIHRMAVEKDAVALFVFLPTERDVGGRSMWRDWVNQSFDGLELNFLDLTPSLLRMSAGDVGGFFIDPGDPSEGHYTEAGNAWVARELHAILLETPAVQRKLPSH
jgi:hypothetical protein